MSWLLTTLSTPREYPLVMMDSSGLSEINVWPTDPPFAGCLTVTVLDTQNVHFGRTGGVCVVFC